MTESKKVYKNPQQGQPLITTICTAWNTPEMSVKFCNLVKPFFYQNSPSIPRYSLTCVIDPEIHKDFLKAIQGIEKTEGVETIIKNETQKDGKDYTLTGNLLIKFQSKDKIPVYVRKEGHENELIELEDELAKGEKVVVVYDILRYTKKNTQQTEHGISFRPSAVFLEHKGK